MSEQIWQGKASDPAELGDEIAAMPTHIVRLPFVEPIEVVTITMSVANRDLVTSTLRAGDKMNSLAKMLEQIADIAEGSGTINSLSHIAKIARAAVGVVGSRPAVDK